MAEISRLCRTYLGHKLNSSKRSVRSQLHPHPRQSSGSSSSSPLLAQQAKPYDGQRFPATTRKVTTQVAKPSNPANGSDDSSKYAAEDGATPPLAADPSSTQQQVDTATAAAPTTGDAAPPSEVVGSSSSSVPAAPSVTGSGGGGGVRGSAAGGNGGGGGGGGQAVALLTRFNGVGYTFVLAGFLKVVTIGGLTLSAPVDTARTAFGKASPYLMVPVGLGLCWVAKQIVDSGLHESKKFLRYMVGVLALLYFGLVKLMYKYEPDSEWVRRPRPRLPGPMAEMRAELGDKDLLAGYGSLSDSRAYLPERPDKELYDDLAWYEGRYPSQLGGRNEEATGRSRAAAAAARMSARTAAAAASDTEADYGDAALEDMLRSRAAAADSDRPAAARVVSRRSFLSDNTR